MQINSQFDTAFSVFRLEAGAGDKRVYGASAVLTGNCALMPPAPEDVALLEGAFSEVKKMFAQNLAFQKSDKVVIGSDTYFIGGIEKFDRGINQHTELIIYKPND